MGAEASPLRVPRWVQWLLASACFALLGRVLFADPASLRAGLRQIRVEPVLGGAALFCLGHYVCHGLLWHQIGRRVGMKVDAPAALRLWSDSLLSRYLPGGVWGLAARLEGYRRAGEPLARTTLAILLEQTITMGASGSAALLVLLRLDPGPRSLAALGATLVAGTAALSRPRLVAWIVEKAARRLNKPIPAEQVWMPGHLWDLWLLSILAYGVSGLGFFWFLRGFAPLAWAAFPYSVGALFFAGLAGMAAFMVPTGLGVREAALAWLLLPLLPPSLATLAAVLSRPWMTVAELVWLIAARLLFRATIR